MFELTIEEAESISRSQNVTLNDKKLNVVVIYSGKTFEADSAYADITDA